MTSLTPQPIFSAEELEYNSKLRDELFNLVSSGDSILFVGSGLSISVGFPSWDGLLKQLEALACKVGNGFTIDNDLRENDPLAYADKIKKYFLDNNRIDRYNAELHSIFSRKTPNFKEFHKKLVKLPFPIVLTTNYDTVLSDALLQVHIDEQKTPDPDLCFPVNDETRPLVSKFLLALHKSLDFPKKVAHLHGYFSRQNEIILTKSDYEKCYNISLSSQTQDLFKPSLHFLVLWSLMATRRIVFFGFGMKDPYLIRLLENVCSELWQWERPTHINIASIESGTASVSKAYAEQLRERFGVDTFFYENEDSTHGRLESLIEELHQVCHPHKKSSSSILEQNPENNTNSLTDTQKLVQEAQGSATGMMSSWILSTNKKLNMGIEDENN